MKSVELSNLTLKRMIKVPEYLLKHDSSTFQGPVTELIGKAKQAIKDGYGLFMHGNTGAGKSVIAGDMACEWLKQQKIKEISNTLCVKRFGDFPLFIPSRDLLDDLRKSYNDNNNKNESMYFNMLRNKSLLVIDDLFKGVAKENIWKWAGPKTSDLIENRHSDEKPFIITSNFTLEEVGEFTHKSTVSRIMERCVVLDFSKIPDTRMKIANERV